MADVGAPHNPPTPLPCSDPRWNSVLMEKGVTSPQPASCLKSWEVTGPKARGLHISDPGLWSPLFRLTSVTSSCQKQQSLAFRRKLWTLRLTLSGRGWPLGVLWVSPRSHHSHRECDGSSAFSPSDGTESGLWPLQGCPHSSQGPKDLSGVH